VLLSLLSLLLLPHRMNHEKLVCACTTSCEYVALNSADRESILRSEGSLQLFCTVEPHPIYIHFLGCTISDVP